MPVVRVKPVKKCDSHAPRSILLGVDPAALVCIGPWPSRSVCSAVVESFAARSIPSTSHLPQGDAEQNGGHQLTDQ